MSSSGDPVDINEIYQVPKALVVTIAYRIAVDFEIGRRPSVIGNVPATRVR